MSSHPEAVKLAPELVEGVTTLARTLVSAARHWTLYPEDHPAVRGSFERLAHAIQDATHGAVLSIGITPDGLLIEGFPVPSNPQVVEAARLLHERDLIRLTFAGQVPAEAIAKLLHLFALDRNSLRERGGPEGVWRQEGHSSITLEQIDFVQVLEDKEQAGERTHDDLWKSIVHSIVSGQKTMDELAQLRLLEIAGDPFDIRELATAVMAPKCTADGAPMITTQAATVLAAFRHLASVASVKAAENADAVMANLAAAAANLDPHIVIEMLQCEDDPGSAVKVVQGLAGAFDDEKVAQLLAAALAKEGQATGRLAEVFDTIAPDPERKRRVLTMTRTMLSETNFGQSKQFKAIWSSMEELLIAYNDEAFVSGQYRSQLDGAAARSEAMALKDLPEEWASWTESLGQQNVRKLSVVLIIDLLKLERGAERAAEIADDMTALAEDLLMSGDFADAHRVVLALFEAGADSKFIAPGACREALARLATSAAMHETVVMLGDFDAESLDQFTSICRLAGPAVVEVLGMTLRVQEPTAAKVRATDIIIGFGAPAISRLAAYVDDERAFVQCQVAEIMGKIGSAEAVPLLQPMLRRRDPRVIRAAVSALASIRDPAAARAIHTVLRIATGEQQQAVIDALVAGRDTRVVPMLARILDESDPLGKDHAVVLATLNALKVVHTDAAVPPIARVARRKKWFAFSRNRVLKHTAVDTLVSIATPESRQALEKAAAEGDGLLRKLARARLS